MIRYIAALITRTYRPPTGRVRGLRQYYRTNSKKPLVWTDRSAGLPRLVIIVAGYKPDFWSVVLNRIMMFTPENTDVCVVSPGLISKSLAKICERNQWSYLATKENQLALAQNLAISMHVNAQSIHKLDEDIIIGSGYFDLLESTYSKAQLDGDYLPGFVSPVLNVNGFSYREFLNYLDKNHLLEFKRLYGDHFSACVETAAWRDPEAAKYLWSKSMPFDQTALLFKNRAAGYSICPHRFSIGAIFFKRELWENMEGFSLAKDGELGIEELDLCAYCCNSSRAILIAHQVFAGHVAFGTQAKVMNSWFKDYEAELSAPRICVSTNNTPEK